MLMSFRGFAVTTLLASTACVAAPAMAAEVENPAGEAVPLAVSEAEPTAVPLADDALLAAVDVADAPVPAIVRVAQDTDDAIAGEMEGESGFEISGNVALVSDYRFRGVSFSDGDMALQGGIDIGHSSGIYVGTWASSITGGTPFGEVELDVYAGWSGPVAEGVTFDIGLLYYIYPTGDFPGVDTDYFEPYASISGDLGPVSATFGVAYAWDQSVIGNTDNLYLYTDFETAIPDTPITLTAHLGYTDGPFSTDTDTTSFDWGLGAAWAVTEGLSLGVNYVDTEGPSVEDFTDAGFFFTLSYSM